MHGSLNFITDFGDSAVSGSVAIIAALTLFLAKRNREALAMLLAFGASALVVLIAKVLLYNCILFPFFPGLRSPSGHAAISAAVYGIFVMIAVSPLKAGYRFLVYALAAALIVLIAVTRIILDHHTTLEVACGLIIGVVVCAGIRFLLLRRRISSIDWRVFTLIALVTAILVHGTRLPAEVLIDDMARHIGSGCKQLP